jgi:Capsule polysaccharide biosynthesis protein
MIWSDVRQMPMMPEDEKERVALLLPPALTESFEITLGRAVDLASDPRIELTVLTCDGAVRGCAVSALSNPSLCRHCCRVRNEALNEHLPGIATVSVDAYLPATSDESTIGPAIQDELQNGVTSTLKTFYRVDVVKEKASRLHRAVFRAVERQWLKYSRSMFVALRKYLAQHAPDRLEFFNGRIVPTRAAALAAMESRTDYGAIEVFGERRRLFTTFNKLVHDLEFAKEELRNYCMSGRVKEELARRFFERRRGGLPTDALSFTNKQRAGLLPQLGDGAVLAIFASSPDELEINGSEWFTEAGGDPARFIAEVREVLPQDYQIVVRMHPNQHGDRTGHSKAMMRRLSSTPGIIVVAPQDPVSSYELLDRADYVLAFESTIGLEAAYWGKPSILAGHAIWEDLGITHNVTSAQDVADLIARGASALPQEIAIQIASFLMDDRGESSTLSWGDGGRYGFFVNGRGYLPAKRASLHYFFARLVDRSLRLNW